MEIKEILFIAPCPTQKCISNSNRIYCKHDCGNVFLLTSEGNLRCPKCPKSEEPFINHKFKCGNNSHDEIEPTQEGTCHSLSELLKQDHTPQEKEFIIKMMSFFMGKFLEKMKKE